MSVFCVLYQSAVDHEQYISFSQILAYQRFPSDSHPSKMAFSIHIEGKIIKRNFQQRLKLHNLQNDGSNFLVCTNISTLNAPIFSQQDKYKNTKNKNTKIQKYKNTNTQTQNAGSNLMSTFNIKCIICTISTIWRQMFKSQIIRFMFVCMYIRTAKQNKED